MSFMKWYGQIHKIAETFSVFLKLAERYLKAPHVATTCAYARDRLISMSWWNCANIFATLCAAHVAHFLVVPALSHEVFGAKATSLKYCRSWLTLAKPHYAGIASAAHARCLGEASLLRHIYHVFLALPQCVRQALHSRHIVSAKHPNLLSSTSAQLNGLIWTLPHTPFAYLTLSRMSNMWRQSFFFLCKRNVKKW